ncbi:hypothetical protein [Streptomyces phaeochromogenes]
MSDPTAVRLKVGHALTVTETALAFLQDARRHGDLAGHWTGSLRSTIR